MKTQNAKKMSQSLSGGLSECEARSRRADFNGRRPSTASFSTKTPPLRNWKAPSSAEKFIDSRTAIIPETGFVFPQDDAAEGGCGVIGMASNVQVAAKHMLQSLQQMRNRGNGKGGGIAAAGLVAEEFGVTQDVLENDYLLAIAYLDDSVRDELEKDFIYATFDVDHVREEERIADFTSIEGLDVRPPHVVEYFVRVKRDLLSAFTEKHGLTDQASRKVEDEFVFQNSYQINIRYYQSTGEKQAFVLSHGKNMLVLKMVGYGDDVIRYYKIEEMHAHVWIGHHRYPTKGRVWHPGGAHPFIGMNEALVHNGDFANHASISEYLSQRNIYPLFLTDTEVAVQVFDLLHRTYDYPLEYVIEAMAPTTERDFTLLPPEKQRIYGMLQRTHMHCSPDGPWFFLIAQTDTHADEGPVYRLTGITDTSMLRPQVFAWQENTLVDGTKAAIGFAASEKQGIDAALESLAETDSRFWTRADHYWNARGGSHTDGGAFFYKVMPNGSGMDITCTDKFGNPVSLPTNTPALQSAEKAQALPELDVPALAVDEKFSWFKKEVLHWGYAQVQAFLAAVEKDAPKDAIALLTLLMDRRYDVGALRRSSVLSLVDESFARVIESLRGKSSPDYLFLAHDAEIPAPTSPEKTVVIDARPYEIENEGSVASVVQDLYAKGWRKYLVAFTHGHRFIGNGLAGVDAGTRIDIYGAPGDYIASGSDGLEIQLHNNGQDQLAQIMKAGKFVVHGDVGQTFMYAAKGGEVYVRGNAAGRPLINAVGKPRVVINGTCLDYLAESFMAGDPLDGGGFVVLNGLTYDERSQLVDMETPYPGGNLFSLASGGAIYVRDPHGVVSEDQLNGGEFQPFTPEDWALIKPYLEENARLFDISIERLLSVDGVEKEPSQVYRKIRPRAVRALMAEEKWVAHAK